MGESLKNNWKKFVDLCKEIGSVATGVGIISSILFWIGIQLYGIAQTFKDYKETIPQVQQLVSDLKTIQEEFKTQEAYRKTVDELKIYTISEVDWLINDTKWRIQNNMTLGFSYIQRLEYYEENISFLTLEQRKDIDYIKKFYYKKIVP